MQKHMGEILENAIKKETKFPATVLAARLNRSRQYIYNLYDKEEIDLTLMARIGKIIQYDFSEEITAFKKLWNSSAIEPAMGYNNLTEKEQVIALEGENKLLQAQVENWKEKYRLLEGALEAQKQINKLLDEKMMRQKKEDDAKTKATKATPTTIVKSKTTK